MAKKSKRQQQRRSDQRARARAENRRTGPVRRPPRSTWSAGKVTFWTIAGVVAFIGLVPAFWFSIAPAISDLVSPVPVLGVIAGWLPVGGCVAALGFYLIIHDDLLPGTRVGLGWALGVWGVLGFATMPVVDSPPLLYDYYTGLEVGFFGALLGGIVVPLGLVALWKPFHRGQEPTTAVWGCALAILGVALLLLAAAVSWLV